MIGKTIEDSLRLSLAVYSSLYLYLNFTLQTLQSNSVLDKHR
jgi:hypothetical protein